MPEDNIPEESSEETPKFIFRDWEDAPTEESKSSIYADWESDEPPPADIDISELLNFDDKNKRTAYDIFADVIADPIKRIPYLGSSKIVAEIQKVENIVFNLENAPDVVSQEDVDFLVHWVKTNNTDSTNWAKMWDIVFEIPGLAGELGVGKLATKGGTYLIKRVMKKEFKEKIAKIYQKKVKNEFARKIIEKTGTAVGTATSVGLITSYNDILPSLNDELAYRKMMPGLVLGPDDSIILTNYGMDEKKAWKQARLEAFFEPAIETLGGSLVKGSGLVVKGIASKVPGVTKGVEAFRKMVLSQTDEVTKNNVILTSIYRQMKKLNPYATEGDVRKILNAFGHDGILGEMLEERFVEGALGITKYLDDKGVLKDFDNPEYDWKLPTFEQMMIEFGAFSIPMAGANIVNTSYDWATTDEAWWDSDIRKQLTEEREKGNFDSEVIEVAERLAKNDPKAFEGKTAINFIDEVREVSREQLRQEGKSEEEIDAFFKGEGLDPIKVGEETVSVLGSTLEDNGKVIINLYKGARADTVVEEFFGSAKRRLSEENLTIWNNYFNEYLINGGTLTSQELFEKEGQDYYFEEGLYADKPIQVVFRKIKQAFDTIFNIQRDKLPDDVRNMYEEAGLGTIGTGTVQGEAVDESFQLSPQKLSKLDATLKELTEEGKSARFWYEESGQAILDLVDGDVEKARQLLSIIAITSPQMDVKTNLGQMIKAYYKYVQGANPEAGRFPKGMAEKIKDVMDGKEFEGIKTSSFYRNLMAQVESSADSPVTVDLWMMRAFGFDKDKPTDLEYKQIEKAVQDIADELGWEPHQVQASIWTSTKARWETIFKEEMERSVKSGAYKNKKWRSKTAESNFRKRMFKRLKETPLSEQKIEDESFSYADALSYYKGVISTETFPHPSTETFENIDNLSYEQMVEYDQEIRKILVDENGKDKIAKLIGLFQAGNFNAPGFYEGDVAPANHLEVLMSTADVSINQEAKDLLELYASIYGILTKQQAVGVTKVFKAKSKKQANVVIAQTKAEIPFEEFYIEMQKRGYDNGAIPQSYGFNVVNFTNENNVKFQEDVKDVIDKVFDNSNKIIRFKRGQSDGLLVENNWKESPNGEDYRRRISESKRQSTITDFIDSTSDEISKLNTKYQKKWSKEQEVTPQDSKESFQLEPTGRKTLYHTTLTKNLPSILKDGLRPYNTTLWVNPDGERQGSGEIYVFESLEDAKRWMLKMEFEFAEEGGATILEVNNTNDSWEEDIDASTGIPKNIMGPDNGKWYRRYEPVEAKDIKRLTDEDIENLSDTKESFQLDSDSVNTSDIEIPEENLRQWLSRKFVDSLSRLKFVERKFGFKEDDWSPSKALENFIGTGSSLMEEFEDLIHKGKNSFVKRLSNAGFTIEQIGEYLYAKHSIERNEEIKRRTGKENGSGMSNEEAEKIINNYKGSGIHKFALEFYRTVTKPALKMRLDKGIITKEQYDTLTKTYKFYVPLKGLLDSEDGYSYTIGKGFSVTTTGIFGARGRESMAGNPFIQAIIDYQSAIMLTEKNKAMVEVYNFLKENEGKGWKISGRKHRAGVDENGDIFFYPEDLKDNELQVFIDGQRQVITITDKALLNALKKLGSGRMWKVLRLYQNFFRMINTAYNPEFLTSNFQRDLQSALINISSDGKKIKWKVIKSIPMAMAGIYQAVRGHKGGQWAELYREYKLNGGKVGWWDFKTIDEKTEDFQREIEKLEKKGDAKAILTATLDFIMDINEVVENAVRLATYKALKDGGLAEKRSAHYAKDLTVNFNRKGEYSHIVNTLYIFSTAGIQGNFRLFRAVWKDGKPNPRGMKVMGGLTVAGFIQSYINRLIDDDDWENVDPWIKDNNWNILIPGDKTLSIKLPWGSNIFVALGGLIEQTIAGEITVGEAGSRFVKASADAFNPMGSTPTLSQGLSPTITDPWIQLGENKNFAGWEIRKDQPKFGPKKPDSQLYFKSVRPLTKDATTWLNKVTGGSEVESGYVDVNPENIDHLIDSYTGGVGRFIANSINTTKTLFSDTPKEIKNIPFVRQHIREIDKSKKPRNKFYKMYEESGRKLFTKKQQDEFEDLYYIVRQQIKNDKSLSRKEIKKKLTNLKTKKNQFRNGQKNIRKSREK